MDPFYPTPNTPALDDRARHLRTSTREHIWVASLYRDLLNRRFDDNGLDFWVRHRFGGASVEGILSEQKHDQIVFVRGGLFPKGSRTAVVRFPFAFVRASRAQPTGNTMSDKLAFSPDQAAHRAGVGRTLIFSEIKHGRLPARKAQGWHADYRARLERLA